MSRPANPAVIGGFVVGAVMLMVFGILLFGRGTFHGESIEYVLYFEDNLGGLDAGAPVEYNGVKIGVVSDIQLVVDVRDHSIHLPVTIQLDRSKIVLFGDFPGRKAKTAAEFINMLIMGGLRARLKSQSMVTGKMKIDLALYPGTVLIRRDMANRPEIPTLVSAEDLIVEKLANIKIDELIEQIIQTAAAIETLFESNELTTTFSSLNSSLAEMMALLTDLRENIGPTFRKLDKTLIRFEKFAGLADKEITSISTDASAALIAAEKAFAQAELALKSVDGAVAVDSPIRYEITTSLQELSAAARSIRAMAEYLERNPEALLSGKGAKVR